MRSTWVLIAALSVSFSCESAESAAKQAADASEKASNAADKTKKFAKDAAKTTKDAVDASKKAIESGSDKAKKTADQASALWSDVPKSGELSATAKGWLASATSEDSVERIIASGKQIAPAALDIGETLSGAIDSESMVEPIFQKVGEGSAADLDKAIGDMPRTEVIDGLTVGFKRLDETSNTGIVKERGYLISWREGDHLIGFVYRSKRSIDVEKLVAETPRLISLTKTVLAGP